MAGRLVTVATFDQAAQARLAKNALDEEGIPAAVNDEALVAMDWLLSNAVGGVKVQVREEDADRAVAALERRFGENGEGFGAAVPAEDLAAQAEAATPDEGEAPEAPAAADPPEVPSAPGTREDYARRLAITAVLGLVLAPVAAYGVYLFLNAAFGERRLSSRGRFNLILGGLMTLAGLAILAVYWPLLFT